MTADAEKDKTRCLLCDSKVGVSVRNSIGIFGDNAVTNLDKPIINILCTALKTTINKENAHSTIVCKKCYKLINEVAKLSESFSIFI